MKILSGLRKYGHHLQHSVIYYDEHKELPSCTCAWDLAARKRSEREGLSGEGLTGGKINLKLTSGMFKQLQLRRTVRKFVTLVLITLSNANDQLADIRPVQRVLR